MATLTIDIQDISYAFDYDRHLTFNAAVAYNGGRAQGITNKLPTPIQIGDTLYYSNSASILITGWYNFINLPQGWIIGMSEDTSREVGSYLVYVNSSGVVEYFVTRRIDSPDSPYFNLNSRQKATNYMYIGTGFSDRASAGSSTSTAQVVYSNYSGPNDVGWNDPDIQPNVSTALGTNIVIPADSSPYPYDRIYTGYVEEEGIRIFDVSTVPDFKVRAAQSFDGQEKYYLVTTTPNANLAADPQNRVIYIDKTGLVDLNK